MSKIATAIFGCGHFWSKEPLFQQLHGVLSTRVGFMGGWTLDPTYAEVNQKMSGHAEVVEVTYDTTQTRFPQLLKAFFSFHDATRDRSTKGGQYRSVVFYRKAKERIITERAIELLRKNGVAATTEIKPAQIFWEAEKPLTTRPSKPVATVAAAPRPNLKQMSLQDAARCFVGS